jgi:hypothetical protein
MIYDTNEYDINLEIPTDNCVVVNFYQHHTESMTEFLNSIPLQNKTTLLILLGAFQNIPEQNEWIDSLNNFCNRNDNPVILFTGKLTKDSNFKFPDDIKFGFFRIRMFELVSSLYCTQNNINYQRDWINDCDLPRQHKFYWASTKDLYPRRFILAGLIHNNLIDDNLVNYKCIHKAVPGPWIQHQIDSEILDIIEKNCHSIDHIVPLPAIDDTVEFWKTDINFYLNSYLGIVTDTFFEDGIFLSEKVFNAMNYQQLFFYVGYNGTLQYLQEQGYQTFNDIIDTSYDSIVDPGKRLIAARTSLLNFLNQPIDTIKKAYIKSIPAIQHNKQLVQQQRPDLQFTQYIQDYLNEHRTSTTNIS